MRIVVTTCLGLLFAASAASAQCFRGYCPPQMRFQPVYSMQPQTVMQPVVTGFQPMVSVQVEARYPTPFRNMFFGRFRSHSMPMGQPIQFQQQQSQSVPQHDHPEFRRDNLQESRRVH